MAVLKCKKCGAWNDPAEWPEEARAEFDPNLCYNCARVSPIEAGDDEEEEPVDTDNDPDGLEAQEEADDAQEGVNDEE